MTWMLFLREAQTEPIVVADPTVTTLLTGGLASVVTGLIALWRDSIGQRAAAQAATKEMVAAMTKQTGELEDLKAETRRLSDNFARLATMIEAQHDRRQGTEPIPFPSRRTGGAP